MKIEEIKKGLSIVGLEPTLVATIKSVEQIGLDSVQVFYQRPDGSFNERLIGRADESNLSVAITERPFNRSYSNEPRRIYRSLWPMSNEAKVETTVQYAKAPLMEAVLEVSTSREQPVQNEELFRVVHKSDDYPNKIDLMVASGQMTVGPEVSATASTQQVGYQYVSRSNDRVVHCKKDGLAFSRLPPYTSWTEVYGEFERHWAAYVREIAPDKISQFAVRYINRFDLPFGRVEMKDYFRTYPEVSADIVDDLNGFMFQLQIPLRDIKANAVVIQARVPPPNPGMISILLDIAIAIPVDVHATTEAIVEPMKLLRQRKNQLFEACLQPAARDLINKE